MKKIILTTEQWMTIVRHTITFAGGILLTAGVISEELWAEVSGGILALGGTFWSIINKK
jgi:hypothetical protein